MLPVRYFKSSALLRACSVTVSVPLPEVRGAREAEAGLLEILLEEWLLMPLQNLASITPMAELYRLKRKIMDSPFRCELKFFHL